MKSFRAQNLLMGWLAFAIAAITYLLCIEPAASLWDCGEFISAAYKLEVGHSPGAPLFLMMGRFFSLFAPGLGKVAMMVNILSALASAFTILFLFWSITHLFCKMFDKKGEELTATERLLCIGSGLVGALVYTFSDTFWFSAVEGEVYATSSLFTALVFWAILKWENVADKPYAGRWLVLIAYLLGLSIGVHLLNLLAIPAIVMVYYFKKYPFSAWGLTKAAIVAILLLASVMYGIIPLLPWFGSWVELLFVNSFGLPVNSGLLFYVGLVAALFILLIRYSLKTKRVLLNTISLCVALICLGYGSYAMVVIRSSANTPMDQNNPDNAFSLMSYLNREQYGSRPLLYGHYYTAPIDGAEFSDAYTLVGKKYVKAEEKIDYTYDEGFCGFFPRMYAGGEGYEQAYKTWGGTNGSLVSDGKGDYVKDAKGIPLLKPSFGDNVSFLVSYQINWMYWRYFMWNFSGRQNDLQGYGGVLKGNWITGIKPLDEARLGNQSKDKLPEYLANNKGHNVYYMLPLLLGLIGMVVQLVAKKKDFTVVMLLFLFTGLAIVFYLNQTPYQPRERDYAYAGSFYAFAIWIGLGVAGVYMLLRKLSPAKIAASVSVAASLGVPVLMATQNWDDHDRSGRYITSDLGYNILNSCLPNAILFTYGDNDTFAPWYEQEVEEERTDVRVSNVSYLYSDWYYNQMMRKTYKSDKLQTSATEESIAGSRRNIVMSASLKIDGGVSLKQAIDFVMSDDPRAKVETSYSRHPLSYLPKDTLLLDYDIASLKQAGVLPDSVKNADLYKPIYAVLEGVAYNKNNVAVLDIIANNYNNRPIYFGPVTPESFSQEFAPYMQMVGLVRQLSPLASKTGVDTEKSFDLFMNKYRFRGLNDSKVYSDETVQRMVSSYRLTFMQLANALIAEGKNEKAVQLLDRCNTVTPELMNPYASFVSPIIDLYAKAGANDKSEALARKLMVEVKKELALYASFPQVEWYGIGREIYDALQELEHLQVVSKQYGFGADLQKEAAELNSQYKQTFRALFQ